jgi:hypothetical protein
MVVGLIAGLVTFSVTVDIRGEDSCPTPAAVAGELQTLASERATDPPYRAFVLSLPDRVHIDFLRADGARLAERDLPPTGTCAERARAAAAVIATWAGIFEREAPPDRSPATPGAAPTPALAATAAEPAARLAPVATATKVAATGGIQPAPALAAGSLWIGVGVLASWAGPASDWVPSAEIALRYSGQSRLGWRASLTGTTAHTMAISSARDAMWSRLAAGIGPSLVWPAGRCRLEAHLQAVGSVLRAQGSGFVSNISSYGVAVGASAGLRVAFPWASGTPWLGIEALYWAGDQRFVVSSSVAERGLPPVELLAGAGLGLGQLP